MMGPISKKTSCWENIRCSLLQENVKRHFQIFLNNRLLKKGAPYVFSARGLLGNRSHHPSVSPCCYFTSFDIITARARSPLYQGRRFCGYIYIYIYVCVYNIYEWMNLYIQYFNLIYLHSYLLQMFVFINVVTHIHTYTYTHKYIHPYTHTHINTYTYTHIHTHTHIHTYTHTHIYTYKDTHIHT